jgi:hypothetical protein
VIALAGCSSPQTPVTERPRETLRASFVPADTTLVAWQGADGLCMEATWGANDEGTGACRFRDTPNGGRYMVGGAGENFTYAYGPVPADARTVRISLADGTSIEAETAPLPPGLAKGRFFLAGLGQEATPLTVTPLDDHGEPVKPQDF